jgi:hypothetical protein
VKQNTGFYPRVQVDASPSAAVGQAGAVLLTDIVGVSGLGVALAQALGPWRKPTAVHHPAKIMLDLAVSLAVGGDCLADAAVTSPCPGRRCGSCPGIDPGPPWTAGADPTDGAGATTSSWTG